MMMRSWTVRLFAVAALVASAAACGKDDCLAACEKGAELCGESTGQCPALCDELKTDAETKGCLDKFESAMECIADANNMVCTNRVWGSPECDDKVAASRECALNANTTATGTGGSQPSTTSAGGAVGGGGS